MKYQYPLSALISIVMAIGCSADQSPHVRDGSTNIAAPKRDSHAPADERLDSSDQWQVVGNVTDEHGNPLPDVMVTASCGAGTLFRTGQATTGPDGRYKLTFSPGLFTYGESSGLQAATIVPSKSGLVEANLHRQGDLLMANREPDPGELSYWGASKERVVIPGRPFELNFTMIPAAEVRGKIVDESGRPVANTDVWLDADELPPSSSVLASETTDADGRFRFTEVPGGEVWLAVRSPSDRMRDITGEKIRCVSDGQYEVELILHDGDAGRLELKRMAQAAD